VAPAEAVFDGERTPERRGLSEETWKSSRRPPDGTAPPLAVGICRPDTTETSSFTGSSGASADLRS
jgi:hypothetical protein